MIFFVFILLWLLKSVRWCYIPILENSLLSLQIFLPYHSHFPLMEFELHTLHFSNIAYIFLCPPILVFLCTLKFAYFLLTYFWVHQFFLVLYIVHKPMDWVLILEIVLSILEFHLIFFFLKDFCSVVKSSVRFFFSIFFSIFLIILYLKMLVCYGSVASTYISSLRTQQNSFPWHAL